MKSSKPRFAGCRVSQDIVQRVQVVGPTDQRQSVMDSLYDRGFRIVLSGPYTNKTLSPRVDPTRFLFIAERVMQDGECMTRS